MLIVSSIHIFLNIIILVPRNFMYNILVGYEIPFIVRFLMYILSSNYPNHCTYIMPNLCIHINLWVGKDKSWEYQFAPFPNKKLLFIFGFFESHNFSWTCRDCLRIILAVCIKKKMNLVDPVFHWISVCLV